MKLSLIKYLVLLPAIVMLIFFSCQNESNSNSLLQIQEVAKNDLQKAFDQLNAITKPESMSKKDYMQYIVTSVYIKQEMKQDISNDTIIYKAKEYFNKKDDSQQAALANFCAGWVYYKNGKTDKAVQCFMQSEYYAEKSGNNLVAGRSQNNIGYFYFEQDIMNTAIIHFKKAIVYYEKEKGSELRILRSITNIGRAFEADHEIDSAYLYFNKGLILAEKIGNIPYQATFSNRLGFVLYQKGDYKRSTSLFNNALSNTHNIEDSIVAQLNLSILYNSKNQLDSAKYYVNVIRERSDKITDKYILLEIYKSLANYNEQMGNYEQANHYNKLQNEVSLKISEENSADKLLEAENNYKLTLEQQKNEKERMKLYLIFGSVISLMALIALFNYFRNKRRKLIAEKREKENELLVKENELLSSENKLLDIRFNSVSFLRSIYRHFIHEWASIEKEVKSLSADQNTTGEPQLYLRIKQLIEEVKAKTNQQMINNAKDYLSAKPSGDKALEKLNDKDLLLLMACYSGYDKPKDLAYILNVVPSAQNLSMRKLDLRNKLEKTGALDSEMYTIIFKEEKSAKIKHSQQAEIQNL